MNKTRDTQRTYTHLALLFNGKLGAQVYWLK